MAKVQKATGSITAPPLILEHSRKQDALWSSSDSAIFEVQADTPDSDSEKPLRATQWQMLPTANHPGLIKSMGLTPELVQVIDAEQKGNEMAWLFELPPGQSIAQRLPLSPLEIRIFIPLCIRLLERLASRGWLCTRLSPQTLYFDASSEVLTLIDPGSLLPIQEKAIILAESQWPPEAHLSNSPLNPQAVHAFVLGHLLLQLWGDPLVTLQQLLSTPTEHLLENIPADWRKIVTPLISPIPQARPESLRQWWQSQQIPSALPYVCRLLGESDSCHYASMPFWHPDTGQMTVMAMFQGKKEGPAALCKQALQNFCGRLFHRLLELDTMPENRSIWQKLCEQSLLQTQQDLIKWSDQTGLELYLRGSCLLVAQGRAYFMHLGGEELNIFNPTQSLKLLGGGQPLQRESPHPACHLLALHTDDRLLLSNRAIVPLRKRLLTPYLCAKDQIILEANYFGGPV